jgi:hypothetical protein
MDPVPMIYYGCVCGLLAYLGPRIAGSALRFVVGVGVGLAAAGVLPALRQAAGL